MSRSPFGPTGRDVMRGTRPSRLFPMLVALGLALWFGHVVFDWLLMVWGDLHAATVIAGQ